MQYKEFLFKHPFVTESEKILEEITIGYHTNIKDNEDANSKPIVWICHALTLNSNPEEWWSSIVGKGKLFDTDKYNIICANILTSCFGSTGPQSINPQTNKPYLFSFPIISIRDIVKELKILALHLGIKQIDLLIGASCGGFQAMEWAISKPDFIKKLVLIATSAKISPWATALNETQRMTMSVDQDFMNSKNVDAGKNVLAPARTIATISYRTAESFRRKQHEIDPDFFLASRACTYQQHIGTSFAKNFNAYSYWYLTKAIDTHNTGRNRGGIEAALAQIKARTLCIAIESDLLFPYVEIENLSDAISNSHFELIHSNLGHDGFILEAQYIGKLIFKHFNINNIQMINSQESMNISNK